MWQTKKKKAVAVVFNTKIFASFTDHVDMYCIMNCMNYRRFLAAGYIG